MNQHIKCQLPVLNQKYKLLSDLPCAAIPRNRYGKDIELQIEKKTGITYLYKATATATAYYSKYSTMYWQTVLPAGLIITFRSIHKYWQNNQQGYEFGFLIESKLNPGWPRFTCRVKELQLKGSVLELV